LANSNSSDLGTCSLPLEESKIASPPNNLCHGIGESGLKSSKASTNCSCAALAIRDVSTTLDGALSYEDIYFPYTFSTSKWAPFFGVVDFPLANWAFYFGGYGFTTSTLGHLFTGCGFAINRLGVTPPPPRAGALHFLNFLLKFWVKTGRVSPKN